MLDHSMAYVVVIMMIDIALLLSSVEQDCASLILDNATSYKQADTLLAQCVLSMCGCNLRRTCSVLV